MHKTLADTNYTACSEELPSREAMPANFRSNIEKRLRAVFDCKGLSAEQVDFRTQSLLEDLANILPELHFPQDILQEENGYKNPLATNVIIRLLKNEGYDQEARVYAEKSMQ